MEPISETPWDVVISGTGLSQSLLALSLSRSSKKVLHVDTNSYYGGADAALSLQEAEEWAAKFAEEESLDKHGGFSAAAIWQPKDEAEATAVVTAEKNMKPALSFSRAYSLSLNPQIIYTRSRLLDCLVSAKVHQQIEFQAVGSWWLYSPPSPPSLSSTSQATFSSSSPTSINSTITTAAVAATATIGSLQRIPSGREAVFADRTLDVRAKRSLMRFLKYAVAHQDHHHLYHRHQQRQSESDRSEDAPPADTDGPRSDDDLALPLPAFLAARFALPVALQRAIVALTLSLRPAAGLSAAEALPRVARHLASLGVLGPGFAAVLPRWGGAAEVVQVACRAGAVGGGVYVLGTGVTGVGGGAGESNGGSGNSSSSSATVGESENGEAESTARPPVRVALSDGDVVHTKLLAEEATAQSAGANTSPAGSVRRSIAIVAASLDGLFTATTEGAPPAAVAVVAFPEETLRVGEAVQMYPVYIMVHSSETGECPKGQCILYGTTLDDGPDAKPRLDEAVARLLECSSLDAASLLYVLHYRQTPGAARPGAAATTAAAAAAAAAAAGVAAGGESAGPSRRLCVSGASVDLAFDDATLESVEHAWRRVMGTDGGEGAVDEDLASSSFMQFEARERYGDDDDDGSDL